ncbi:hypothetical protein [Pelagibacterium xiamenense]|uniref:hypothetical protein n=1 Tax=Pelagibacterium xiamenense TaxID=2901140 RepID=UPI001E609C43|nr:hypothetical protein [Pelagibacterium xiamenense]MCD7060808.1 hypothetical protein [Pelagibacterium xiamenense]
MTHDALRLAALGAVVFLGWPAAAQPAGADSDLCIECLQVRVGPPVVVRGPFPDELDAPFTALRLDDGSFRGFSANGSTYAIEGESLWDMGGPRREVLEAGEPGQENECGRWLTSAMRYGDAVLGFVHQESICDYGPQGQTDKTMAIAISSDDGLTWTDLGTVITGPDSPGPGTTSGEGDCTMVDGADGYLYAYCLRNSDWQTIVARAQASEPTAWHKYHQGDWTQPGLDGQATAIGFLGPGAGYLKDHERVVTVTVDPWFGGVRLSLSADKVSFVDVEEPLIPIDGSDWNRPADTDLIAYPTILNPDNGSNAVDMRFLLSYIYVPPGQGFESRYLVHHEIDLSVNDDPLPVQAGLALTRWTDPDRTAYVTSTGPMTGERLGYRQDAVVAYMLTVAPPGLDSVKIAECSTGSAGEPDHLLAEDGGCENQGYVRERTAGWLYLDEQPGTVPVYRCVDEETQSRFGSSDPECEGRGAMELRLGYGLAP